MTLGPGPGEPAAPGPGELRRDVGLTGAVLMGLGSIVGTGLFVSLGIAAGVAGSGILLAKSASAATAALGLAGYLLVAAGVEDGVRLRVLLAGGLVVLLTVLVGGGIRRSNRANAVVVGITLTAFVLFLAAGLPRVVEVLMARALDGSGAGTLSDLTGTGPGALLHATALLFVAYTGYGRIATLGEEVRDPARTIPRAIWITLATVGLLYTGVAAVALATVGPDAFAWATAETAAPLRGVAQALGVPGLPLVVALAAITAMVGVLLNLLLGLSRVALAMGRRRDLPGVLDRVDAASGSPRVAVAAVGAVILVLVLLGDVRTTWSFSAFTVLIYYGITNLAALRLPPESRRYPRWVAAMGLVGCLFLAFQVEMQVWLVGSLLLVGGLGLRVALRREKGGRPAGNG